ncbi:uncharacterized protein LOC131674927 [Phymastichus coffea]|uniref:uncharacterized protein LOC131674927 n=1 Tax=Phymastichus coffea TaxID=108790 RepID=UPI00273C5004|nr:uncharacterized protein LOC131674927 [Phymastichus coffea]
MYPSKDKYQNMWLNVVLIPLLLSSIEGKTAASRKKVCIIGAGVSGLATVKRFSEHTDEFKPIVFEKQSDVGGLWSYTESTTVDEHGLPVHSSVYKNLRTNIPKELMAWPDYRNFTGDDRSSVPHHMVLEYLRNYTAHFNLRQFIEFDTLVEHVRPLNVQTEDWQQTRWLVKTRNLKTQKRKHTVCNGIAIANGHYTKGNVPEIPGIENFRGPIIHSHVYRHPEDFAGKTVTILGAWISGVDIALDISPYVKKIYLSSRHEKRNSKLPSNIEQVPNVIEANGNELIMSNGSTITSDAFIFCTGYLPEFPFLDENCGIRVEANHVIPLYKQMINAEHPSMAVIGLPTADSIFLMPYVQSQFFVALLQGRVKLPTHHEMIKDAYTLPPGAPEDKWHAVNAYQWTYNEELAKATGNIQLPPSYYKDGIHLYEAYRDTHLATFREVRFVLNPNGTFHLENLVEDYETE